MYAVAKHQENQYLVKEGDSILLDVHDVPAGTKIELDDVLFYSDADDVQVGRPTVAGASIVLESLGAVKDDKVTVYTFRRRKDSHRKKGHRQAYTQARVIEIRKGE